MTPLSFLASLVASVILFFARFITAVRAIWAGTEPIPAQRVYYANHCSHGDFVLIWTVLPPRMRQRTRPVAGADYWLKSPLRKFIGKEVFNSVLIDRNPQTRTEDPIEQMAEALEAGDSLIVFPEGTRNTTDAPLLDFRSGLFHLARSKPDIDLVPVWVANLNRVMPKGEKVPIPLICTVTFGPAIRIEKGEEKGNFLKRASTALLSLAPSANGEDA